MTPPLKLFTGNANRPLAESVAGWLGQPLVNMTVTRFSDGEVRVRCDESVRGADAFIIQPTCPPVNDNLMELLVICDALKRASARRIVPVIPYYGYGRQDRKAAGREPITAKLVADLLTRAGAERIFAIDLHAAQIQGFFDVPVDHLPAGPIIADYLRGKQLCGDEIVVVSPDVGGVERASYLAEALGARLAIIAKRRPEPNRAEVVEIIGEVEGRVCIMFDDIIDTGGSIAAGAEALVARGAASVYACCTHAVFSGDALARLLEAPLTEVIVTDTIPLATPPATTASPSITVLSVAPLLARVIEQIHNEDSVSTLFENHHR